VHYSASHEIGARPGRPAVRICIHDLLLWRSWVDAYRATAAFFSREL
jgi:hypothetical protein